MLSSGQWCSGQHRHGLQMRGRAPLVVLGLVPAAPLVEARPQHRPAVHAAAGFRPCIDIHKVVVQAARLVPCKRTQEVLRKDTFGAHNALHKFAGIRLRSTVLRSQGKVKQIVGSTLKDLGEKARRACRDWDGCLLHAPCSSIAGLLGQNHGRCVTQRCSASFAAYSKCTQC